MSTISDYASLLVDAGEYAVRNDVAHLFPRFIGLAETKMNRVLRVADMETSATLTIVDGDGALPADFIEARAVVDNFDRPLNAWSLSELNRRFGSRGGQPAGYAIVGRTIKARPISDGALTITYYGKIPGLSPTNPSNWLLETAPDVYLYAAVEEIAIWERDADKAGAARSLKEQAMAGLSLADKRARWGNGQFILGAQTP